MTEQRHPLLSAALDRRRPLAERRQSYAAWANAVALLHIHPRLGLRHAPPGGDDPYHTHPEGGPHR